MAEQKADRTKEQWLAEELEYIYQKDRGNEALTAFEQALHLDPTHAPAWSSKGAVLGRLKHFGEALEACEQALRLDPSDARAWNNKGVILEKLKRFEEALGACEQALRLDPTNTAAQNNKEQLLWELAIAQQAKWPPKPT